MILNIIAILLLIVLNGAFAMAEIALISARRARLKEMAETGVAGARLALELAERPNQFFSTLQIGVTLIAVLSGTIGGATLADELASRLARISELTLYAHSIAIAIVVLGVSFLSLIFGELAPKRLALSHAERISASLAPAVKFVLIIARPAVWLLSTITDLVLRLLPIEASTAPPVTDEEIKMMMDEGAASGHFHETERDIVEMALRLGDRRIEALMTPRTQIVFLDLNDSAETILAEIVAHRYARYPVIEGAAENLLGIVYIKDLMIASLQTHTHTSIAGDLPRLIRAALRQPLFIPDTAPALRALELFRKSGARLAVIVDEYGDMEGLVSLTDVLEALVGEIVADDALEDSEAIRRADGSWLIDGMMAVDQLSDLAGLEKFRLSDDDRTLYQTLGGLMMAHLKRIPIVADRVELGNIIFEVVGMDGRRVDKVLVIPPAAHP